MASDNKKFNLFQKPTHLIAQQEDNNDISGVISEMKLQSLLEIFCVNVKCPIMLISFYDSGESGDMKRLDSAISSISLHYCCEAFRICAGEKYCIECDLDHACFFKGDSDPVAVDSMEEHVNKKIEEYVRNKFKSTVYYNHEAQASKYEKIDSTTGYLQYYCPILGFEELIFPVVVSGRILGIIFCGQIQSDGKADELGKEIRINFLKKTRVSIDSYIKEHLSGKAGKRIMDILEEGNDLYKENIPSIAIDPEREKELIKKGLINKRNPSKLSSEQHDELIENIRAELEKLTYSLEKSMQTIRKNYVARVVKDTIFKFSQDDIRVTVLTTGKNKITGYWDYVKDSLDIIVNDLSLHSIQVYGAVTPHSDIDENCTHLGLVAHSKYNQNNLEKGQPVNKEEYFFRIEKADKKILGPFRSLHNLKLGYALSVLPGDESLSERIHTPQESVPDKSSCMNILFYPVQENLYHSSVLVIYSYKEPNDMDYLEDSSFIDDAISMELYLFSNLIFNISSYLLDSLLQSSTEMVLRFFKHELSHVLLGYNFLNYQYIQDFNYYKSLDEDKRQAVQGDFISTEEMLRAIAGNIELLTQPKEEIKIVKEEFKIFKELFYKWENMYRYEKEAKNLYFDIPHVTEDDPVRPLIISNRRLLEQIIYNIVSNAIKYSYWGTKITMDCKRMDIYEDRQILSVTDYGAGIDEDGNIYNLYYRGQNIKQVIGGSGIGLYVVKKISELLGFEVRHQCEFISNYNVGLIDAYLDRTFVSYPKDKALIEKLEKAKDDIGDKIRQLTNDFAPEEMLEEKEIIDMIKMETYKVTFEVII